VPFFGAALLKKSLVGSFFVVGEGREYLGWHWAGGVHAGVVEGADGRVHLLALNFSVVRKCNPWQPAIGTVMINES
jgi:hypothetical protein